VRIFQEVNAHIEEKGLRLSEGTIMDATIINAPSSTKKGNQYSIGMKIHAGVDRASRTVHSLVTTPADVQDSKMVEEYQLRLRALSSVDPVHGSKGPAGVDRGVAHLKSRQKTIKTKIATRDAKWL